MSETNRSEIFAFVQIISLFVIFNYNAYFLVPSFEALKNTFGFSDTQLGLLSGGYLFANGFSTIIWSYLSETKFTSRKIMLSLSFLIAGILILTNVFINSPVYFTLIIILSGFSLGSVLPLGFSMIADIFISEERTQAYTLWYTFGGFGITLGIAISSIIGSIFTWRYTLLVDALLLFIGAILSWLTKEPVRGWADLGRKSNHILQRMNFVIDFKAIKTIVTNKSNILLIITGALQVIPDTVLLIWGFQFVVRELKVNSIAALIYLSIIGSGAFGGILLARLVDKTYIRNVEMRPFFGSLFCLLSALFFLLFFLSDFTLEIYDKDLVVVFFKIITRIIANPYVLLASSFYFIGKFINTPLGPIKESVLADVNLPEHRSIIKSFMIIIELLARSISTLIVGLLSDLICGVKIAIIVMLSPWILASFFWIVISKNYEIAHNKIREKLRERVK